MELDPQRMYKLANAAFKAHLAVEPNIKTNVREWRIWSAKKAELGMQRLAWRDAIPHKKGD